jgi:hypothetical protein
VDRRTKLEDDYERRRRELEAGLGAEREALLAQHAVRVKEIEAEKTRQGSLLAQTEAAISERYGEQERRLRQELNMSKIEYAAQFDDKVRKLGEEREALRKDYEQKLRDLENRRKPGG